MTLVVRAPEHVFQRGIAAVQIWNAVEARRSDVPCRVSARRTSDLFPIATAEMHSGGVHGFLRLAPGTYFFLIEPLRPGFLPSKRTVVIPPVPAPPAPPPPPVFVDVLLRPASTYVRPPHAAVVRGTVQWSATKRPARWACIYGFLRRTPGPPTPINETWTRSDAHGEFGLILRHPPPNSDGLVPGYTAFVEIHATTPPPPGDLADTDYSDLIIDDGTDAAVRARQPLSRTVSSLCKPNDDLSLNSDTYNTTDPKTGVTLTHKVILLT